MRARTQTFSSLLRDYAHPREGDSLKETISRAEVGIRLVGAVVVSAVATLDLPPGPAGRMRRLLVRPRSGDWAKATRLALFHLVAARHRLSPWSELREASFDGRGRPIDRWLTDYETALRHHEHNPPALAEAGLRHTLANGISLLCHRLVDALDSDLPVDGDRAETRLRDDPCAPFLVSMNGRIHLWDGIAGRGGSSWLDVASNEYTERRETSWEVGAAVRLNELSGRDPFVPFLAEGPADMQVKSDRPMVFVVSSGRPLDRAEGIAASFRSSTRPAIVVPLDDGDTALGGLALIAGGDPELSSDDVLRGIESWTGERPVLLFAGAAIEPQEALALEESLAKRTVLGFVVPRHIQARWPPEILRRFELVHDEAPEERDPESVCAQYDAGRTAELAWAYGAMAHFELVNPASIERFLRVRNGLVDPLEDQLVYEWWDRGDLQVEADGRARFSSAGWTALAAGLAGEPSSDDSPAWRGGRWLATHIGRKDR